MTKPDDFPTERDFDLMEVALDSAAQSVQWGVTLRTKKVDPLAAEYLHALQAVQQWRKNQTPVQKEDN